MTSKVPATVAGTSLLGRYAAGGNELHRLYHDYTYVA